MSNEIKPLKAENSLCWKCRFGVCVQETETEKIVHPAFMMDEDDEEDDDKNPFGNPDEDQGRGESENVSHLIEHERVKTVCFWRPAGLENMPPILVSLVNKCNRFEQKTT